MPIDMHCECGHHWQVSEGSAGRPVECAGCGVTLLVPATYPPGRATYPPGAAAYPPGPAAYPPGPAPSPGTPYGYALAPSVAAPSRGLAITGGVLSLLASLGHAFIGLLLLVLAAFLAAFVHALLGDLPRGSDAQNEMFGILGFLFVYTGLCTLSCIPAIIAIMGRYWAVFFSALFQALLCLGMVYLTVRSREWLAGVAATFSATAAVFCLLGLRQVRDHAEYLRQQRPGASGPPRPWSPGR